MPGTRCVELKREFRISLDISGWGLSGEDPHKSISESRSTTAGPKRSLVLRDSSGKQNTTLS
jgi:hypothetical protein